MPPNGTGLQVRFPGKLHLTDGLALSTGYVPVPILDSATVSLRVLLLISWLRLKLALPGASVKKVGYVGRVAGIPKVRVNWRRFCMTATTAAMIPVLIGCVAAPMARNTPTLVDTPRLVVTPSSVSFSSAIVGVQTTQTLKLANTGEAPLTVTGVIANGAGLSISGFSGSTLLSPGTSHTITVQFIPKTAGAFKGDVSVLTSVAEDTAALPVTGEVAAAKLAIGVGPASVSFGTVAAGNTVSQNVTLTNTGNSDVTISKIWVSGASVFSMAGGAAPLQLESEQSVTVDVKFDPKSAGSYTGALTVDSNASDPSVSVALSGSVSAPSAAHTVGLAWDPSGSKVSGYNVYRGGASAGPFTRLNGSLIAKLSYNDATVVDGSTYYYVTTAVDSEGVESGYSNTATAVVP
jgi:hypothetical protein